MLNFQRYNDLKLNECVILGKPIDDRFILFKQRDRGFYPDNRVVREEIDGVEIVSIEDLESGWKEGMNEFGICLINSRLSSTKDHLREPRELFTPIILPKDKLKDIKSEKVDIIMDILSKCKDIDTAKDMVISKKLMGTTLLSDGRSLYEIEVSDDYGDMFKKHSATYHKDETLIVRTNHGVLIPDIGYQEYPGSVERHSSEIRKSETERRLLRRTISDITEMFSIMSLQPFELDSEMNVFRTTKKSMTGGQLMMDPLKLSFYYRPIENFKGVEEKTDSKKINIITI